MANCSNARVLPIAIDARVASERDDSAAVTWNDPSQWSALVGATAIEIFPLFLGREGSPTVTLVAEGSLDGRTFFPLPQVEQRCAWGPSDAPEPVLVSLSPRDASPIVRFGLQVEDGAARLTVMVVVHRDAQRASQERVTLASLTGANIPVADADADTWSDSALCRDVVVLANGSGVSGSLELVLRTSDDGSTWYDVAGAAMTLTSADPSKIIGVLASAGVLRYVRLYTAGSNTGSAASGFNAAVWVRS
jgi:hypothetical protein